MAGIAAGVIDEDVLAAEKTKAAYRPVMGADVRERKISGWKEAVRTVLGGTT